MGRFGSHLGSPNRPHFFPQIYPRRSGFRSCDRMVPRWPPSPSQEGPRAPKSGPRPPQDPPKRAQDRPRAARDPPKTVQRGPKSPQERLKKPPIGRFGVFLGLDSLIQLIASIQRCDPSPIDSTSRAGGMREAINNKVNDYFHLSIV